MADIMVVAEHRGGSLAEVSLEMLSEGRRLADRTDGGLAAVVVGMEAVTLAPRLARWADTVLAVKGGGLEHSLAGPYQKALAPIVRERKPWLVLMGHTSFGMDLAPALAVEIGAPLATDCTGITVDNGNITVVRSIYNGKVNGICSFAPSPTIIVTGRPGRYPVEPAEKNGTIEEFDCPTDGGDRKRFEGHIDPESGDVDIAKAEVIVAVGRGIKDRENLKLAEDLAGVLGGVLGCSRPVVDYGWLPAAHQVGLSGKTVKPRLYIALGISGAFQHMVGLRGAGIIVAINKDERAPIFADAHYGIVGDLRQVVPALVHKLSEAGR